MSLFCHNKSAKLVEGTYKGRTLECNVLNAQTYMQCVSFEIVICYNGELKLFLSITQALGIP